MAHGVSCNCEDCWWTHDQKVVDEFGIVINEESEPVTHDNGPQDP